MTALSVFATDRRCGWCKAPFRAISRKHRHPVEFCRDQCRQDFYSAARAYTKAEIIAGRLTVDVIRGALGDGV